MFDLPEAICVRRDEVRSPASSRASSPVNESDLQDARARLGKLLNLDELLGASVELDNMNNVLEEQAGEEDEEEFEFRLFNTPANPHDAVQKDGDKPENESNTTSKTLGDGKGQVNIGTQKLRIRLRSPTPGSSDPSAGRFVKASRGWQYYFSTPSLWGSNVESEEQEFQPEKARQYQDMAVTGEYIKTLAKSQPWPGCHLAWRVVHLKRHQTKLPRKDKDVPVYVVESEPTSKSPKSRKKPGKKRRVLLRKRAVAVQLAKEADADKRTRKNRERKLKRRQKAREQKAATDTAGGDIHMTDADGASSGDD
ncbi:hypothetical protein N7466_007954 [Penicillium verhagenii]|uniref:uncharacterized protein n=1 Tax=Penicillium verhagenii TaxID=1562060 RepID=UPI00254546C3|nr:uncharacterized protein N7466_007954 [Penicillium verhagenii]KAJ5928998.1 hypothetical protein N7466_007954 [Penicillium verhagenii]